MLTKALLVTLSALTISAQPNDLQWQGPGKLWLYRRPATFQEAIGLCQRYNSQLVQLTSANILDASKLLDVGEAGWVRSWNGDVYNNACLVMKGTAVVVSPNCDNKFRFVCERVDGPIPPHKCTKTVVTTSTETETATSTEATTTDVTMTATQITTVTSEVLNPTCCAPTPCSYVPDPSNRLIYVPVQVQSGLAQDACLLQNATLARIDLNVISPFFNGLKFNQIMKFCTGELVSAWVGKVTLADGSVLDQPGNFVFRNISAGAYDFGNGGSGDKAVLCERLLL